MKYYTKGFPKHCSIEHDVLWNNTHQIIIKGYTKDDYSGMYRFIRYRIVYSSMGGVYLSFVDIHRDTFMEPLQGSLFYSGDKKYKDNHDASLEYREELDNYLQNIGFIYSKEMDMYILINFDKLSGKKCPDDVKNEVLVDMTQGKIPSYYTYELENRNL